MRCMKRVKKYMLKLFMTESQIKYDVCLSFAGEDREYVDRVANILRDRDVNVLYDKFVETELWGKDLYQHLDMVYRKQAKYCVIFISKYYVEKVWTKHELKSAQAKDLLANDEYILPVRFDNTEVPGLPESIGYLYIGNTPPDKFAEIIIVKIGLEKSNSIKKEPKSTQKTIIREATDNDEKKLKYANLKIAKLNRATLRRR